MSLAVFLVLFSALAFAEPQNYYAEQKVALGEYMNCATARRLALSRAVREAAAKACLHIYSQTEVLNSKLTRDQIKTRINTNAQGRILREKPMVRDNQVFYYVKVRVTIDPNKVTTKKQTPNQWEISGEIPIASLLFNDLAPIEP
ncbi:MAG: hypothetical protein SVS15_04655 [Thermodesulfobacteriota bacterium]|nr:hypothetical protein [Thermodesulfobacteriota bacterium]